MQNNGMMMMNNNNMQQQMKQMHPAMANPMAMGIPQMGGAPQMPGPQGMSMPRGGPTPRAPDDCTLYVGGLAKNTDDARVFGLFSQFGHVLSARILRDSFTGASRRFGFVSFSTKNDAANALKALRFSVLDGGQINVNWKNDNPKNFPNEANLYISNLDKQVTERELFETLGEFGTIASVLVRKNEQQEVIGYGYVQFKKAEDAERCISEADGLKLHENAIHVEVFKSRGKRGTINAKNNLYVHTFPENIKTQEETTNYLNEVFGTFGEISSLHIGTSAKHGGNFFAFVAFKNAADAQTAFESLKDKEINSEGHKLYLNFAQTKDQRKREQVTKGAKNENNFYMRSIRNDVTEEQVRAVFAKYGKIGSIKLKTHEFNAKEGAGAKEPMQFGFICFENVDEAKNSYVLVKDDEEVKALLHANHKPNTAFYFYFQNKGTRKQYNKMARKNNTTTSFYSKQMNDMIKNFLRMFRGNGRGPQGSNKMMGNQQQDPNMMMKMQQMMMSMQNPMMQQQMRQQQMMQQQQMAQMQQMQAQQAQQGAQQNVQQNIQQSAVKDVNWLKANLEAFNGYKQQEKKNLLGTMMYNQVAKYSPEQFVPKITGMLIDLEVLGVNEIVEILDNPEVLKERIAEAIKIIEEDNEQN